METHGGKKMLDRKRKDLYNIYNVIFGNTHEDNSPINQEKKEYLYAHHQFSDGTP